jgi:adenosylcobinamide-phosphate guanylyltransferase
LRCGFDSGDFMVVTALVMAGGKGSRMKLPEEKPLVKACGKPLIDYVLSALKNAKKVDQVVVAVSSNTPKTEAYLKSQQVPLIKTPGVNNVADMGYAVEKLGLETVLTISADLPLVTGQLIDAILECFLACGKPALSVVVPIRAKEKHGMSIDYAYRTDQTTVVPSGINVLDGRKRFGDEPMEQSVCLLEVDEIAVNVNTIEELAVAEKLLSKK